MNTYDYHQGSLPLLLSMPHNGTGIPDSIAITMTDDALRVPDTDWHVSRLYDFAAELGVSIISPLYSRFVVDLNRPPDNQPLYPGASNTELCPTTTFDRLPIYKTGQEPGAEEVRDRVTRYWRPYHDKVSQVLTRMHAEHGVVLLFEAHSIRSVVPRFFSGRLPDLNLGTAAGASCAPALETNLSALLRDAHPYTFAVNGRFKGGHITRTFGDPDHGRHAVQLELSQITYMNEDYPFEYREDLAAGIRPILRNLLENMLHWGRQCTATNNA